MSSSQTLNRDWTFDMKWPIALPEFRRSGPYLQVSMKQANVNQFFLFGLLFLRGTTTYTKGYLKLRGRSLIKSKVYILTSRLCLAATKILVPWLPTLKLDLFTSANKVDSCG